MRDQENKDRGPVSHQNTTYKAIETHLRGHDPGKLFWECEVKNFPHWAPRSREFARLFTKSFNKLVLHPTGRTTHALPNFKDTEFQANLCCSNDEKVYYFILNAALDAHFSEQGALLLLSAHRLALSTDRSPEEVEFWLYTAPSGPGGVRVPYEMRLDIGEALALEECEKQLLKLSAEYAEIRDGLPPPTPPPAASGHPMLFD